MTKRSSVISFNNVTKKFGRFTAVESASFDIYAGEVVGFVGVNGAGKTTAINILLGFSSPSKGTVSAFNHPITPANAHESHTRMGYAAGDMELPLHMTGRQYLDFVTAQHRGDHSKQLALLEKEFKPQLTKKIGTLSRGNKQKIALIAAFASSPDLVVLDEPTSGLDPIMQDVFLDLVRREQIKGTTVFMSSHYLQEVAEVCSRMLLMKNGKIVKDLSSAQLSKAEGKIVRVVTLGRADPPAAHTRQVVVNEKQANYFEMTFIFDGAAEQLVKWTTSMKDVVDIEINKHTLEAEFRSLYDEAEKVSV